MEVPAYVLAKIPLDIPQFMEETPASRELRTAYIQHLISSTLDSRMFQPFQFTLGRRNDKTDAYLQSLWTEIRRKSIRRETLWRQQTLKAAYTTPDARQSINEAAEAIIDEIVDEIRHFTDPRYIESVTRAVRKIVKLAAETWRQARVEKELVTATMDMDSSEEKGMILDQGWNEFQYNLTKPDPEQAQDQPRPERQVLLHTMPRIVREACHRDLLDEDDSEKGEPCVFLHGVVLYTDSPAIISRREELNKGSGRY